MRVDPAPAPLTLRFEGRPIPARPGETLAAALAAAGELSLRRTRTGAERGLFCGMGVCQECLVEVDGVTNQRACMTTVEGVREVRRQGFPAPLPTGSRPLPPVTLDRVTAATPEVLVVGGGAGGLAAAAIAAEAGAEVVLLDERPALGGQYYKQPAASRGALARPDRQFAGGQALIERARLAGVRLVSEAQVWGAFAPLEVAALTPAGAALYRPQRLIVATGAYERGLPVPGWTLPGVMTTGAAQTLLRSYGVVAGRRVLVAGNGPLNLQVALELAQAGAEIVALAELAAASGPGRVRALWRMASSTPGLVRDGWRYLALLRQQGVRPRHGEALLKVEAERDGLRAWLGPVGGPAVAFETDLVCMGYGFMPANELLRALGCRHSFDPARGHLVTLRGPEGATSVAGVYAVGDCCGLGGAPAAVAEGLIAGAAAAASLGHPLSRVLGRERDRARSRLRRHRRFQAGLWALYAAERHPSGLADAMTVVCRCEEVTLGDIEAALLDGQGSMGELKRCTRLGMGPCQGRYCGPVLADLLAERHGRVLDEMAFFAPRVPIKPVPIAELARLAEP